MIHLLLPFCRQSGEGEALFGHHSRGPCHGHGHVAQPSGRLGQHSLAGVVGFHLACRHVAAGAVAATVVGGGGHSFRVLCVLRLLRVPAGALPAQDPQRIPHSPDRRGQRPARLAGWARLPQPDTARADADERDLQPVPADQLADIRLKLRLRQRPGRPRPDTGVIPAGAELAQGQLIHGQPPFCPRGVRSSSRPGPKALPTSKLERPPAAASCRYPALAPTASCFWLLFAYSLG
jgi:hypothetical protein